MPLQNRVTPIGEIVASNERGALMGNRGILHDEHGRIIRQSFYDGWKFCKLEHEGNRRKVMSAGRYTELFFLDEATALAAGHRPCFECHEAQFYRFRTIWTRSNARLFNLVSPPIAKIDRILHKERIDRIGRKVFFRDQVSNIPDGTFIEFRGDFYLRWQGIFHLWSFAGYVSARTFPPNLEVVVLTPESIVRCFRNGLKPAVHESIKSSQSQLEFRF